MSETAVAEAPSVETLLWEADRLSESDLTPQQLEWFENVAKFLWDTWPDVAVEAEKVADEAEEETFEKIVAGVLEIVPGATTASDLDEFVQAVKDALEEAREEGVKDATIPSRANTARRKALRLLVEGRVVVERLETSGRLSGLVVASCKSESGDSYQLGYDPLRRRWGCTCPELKGDCSHLAALKQIVPPPAGALRP